MKSPNSFVEKRAFGRRPTNIEGSVRAGHRLYDCVIKDISEGGALLEFKEAVSLPARLWLSWPDHKGEVVCEVRHARGNTVGVQFHSGHSVVLRPLAAGLAAEGAAPVERKTSSAPDNKSSAGAGLVAERRKARGPANAAPPLRATPAVEVPVLEHPSLVGGAGGAFSALTDAQRVPGPLPAAKYAVSPGDAPPAGSMDTTAMPLDAGRSQSLVPDAGAQLLVHSLVVR